MRIGARGSDLAQVQARTIQYRLQLAGFETEIFVISTHGDRILDRPLNELGVQGVFTKEIEEKLLAGVIDLGVHSFKDVASAQPDGLEIVAVTEREDCADLLVIDPERYNAELGILPVAEGASIGTSAIRRSAQALALRPDLTILDLRGNVPTRLEKLRAGKFDAIFLASAGVNRLGLDLSNLKAIRLDPRRFIPSPGQGALAIEMRSDDPRKEVVARILRHEATTEATALERGLLKRFGGGCSLPLGAWAVKLGNSWTLHGFWGGGRSAAWNFQTESDSGVLLDKITENLLNISRQ